MLPLPKTPDPEILDTPDLPNEPSALVGLVELIRVSTRQSQMFCWPAGTHVVVLRGQVQLTETPEWQGETLLRPSFALQTHASHTLRRDGWVVVLAQQDAVLRVVRPAPAPAVQLRGVRAFWQNTLGWLGLRPQKLAD
jgi:hypothetical protein